MSETRLVRRDELLQGDKGGGFRGRQPNACFLDAAICAELRPADVLVYVKRSQGRENRPYKKRSTVDAKSDAFCKSYSAPKRQTKSLRYHCTTVAHSSNRLPHLLKHLTSRISAAELQCLFSSVIIIAVTAVPYQCDIFGSARFPPKASLSSVHFRCGDRTVETVPCQMRFQRGSSESSLNSATAKIGKLKQVEIWYNLCVLR